MDFIGYNRLPEARIIHMLIMAHVLHLNYGRLLEIQWNITIAAAQHVTVWVMNIIFWPWTSLGKKHVYLNRLISMPCRWSSSHNAPHWSRIWKLSYQILHFCWCPEWLGMMDDFNYFHPIQLTQSVCKQL